MQARTPSPRLGDFQYEPLNDPKKALRLLRLEKAEERSTRYFSYALYMESVELEHAPSYIAISYTWGAGFECLWIEINGLWKLISANSLLALKHAQLMNSNCAYWIDAICIDQNNLEEKADQVQLMGSIYAGAISVVASLGPDTDDDIFLKKMLLDFAGNMATLRQRHYSESELLEGWLDDLTDDKFQRFCKSLMDFGRRTYWKRVWIVQELFVAAQTIAYCGNGEFPLHTLLRVLHILGQYPTVLDMQLEKRPEIFPVISTVALENLPLGSLMYRSIVRLGPGKVAMARASKRLDLSEALTEFQQWGCSNHQDRIYGFLQLIKWPGHLSYTIAPDYNRSIFHLALQCLDFLGDNNPPCTLSRVRQLLQTLRVDSHCPEIIRLIDKRRDALTHSSNGVDRNIAVSNARAATSASADQHTLYPTLQSGERRQRVAVQVVARILQDSATTLTATFSPESPEHLQNFCVGKARLKRRLAALNATLDTESLSRVDRNLSMIEARFRDLSRLSNAYKPTQLMMDSNIAGFLCHGTRAGDYLLGDNANRHSGNGFAIYLVARRLHNDLYDIIGQAVVIDDYYHCSGGDLCDCVDTRDKGERVTHEERSTEVEVYTYRDDLIAFVAQDLISESTAPMDPDVGREIRRLILERPEIRVTIKRLSSFAIFRRTVNNPARTHECIACRWNRHQLCLICLRGTRENRQLRS